MACLRFSDLLRILTANELDTLEKALCSQEEPKFDKSVTLISEYHSRRRHTAGGSAKKRPANIDEEADIQVGSPSSIDDVDNAHSSIREEADGDAAMERSDSCGSGSGSACSDEGAAVADVRIAIAQPNPTADADSSCAERRPSGPDLEITYSGLEKQPQSSGREAREWRHEDEKRRYAPQTGNALPKVQLELFY